VVLVIAVAKSGEMEEVGERHSSTVNLPSDASPIWTWQAGARRMNGRMETLRGSEMLYHFLTASIRRQSSHMGRCIQSRIGSGLVSRVRIEGGGGKGGGVILTSFDKCNPDGVYPTSPAQLLSRVCVFC